MKNSKKPILPFSAATVHDWLADNAKDDLWGGLTSLRKFSAIQHKDMMDKMVNANLGKDRNGCWKT